jgi:membrane-bound metal-dependent hydrolase YbcI (DUF457 family)
MCEGRTHATHAAAAYLAVATTVLPFTHATIGGTGVILATGTCLAFGAGPLSDIDQPRSTVARSLGFLTGAFHWLLRPFPHRTFTHSLLAVAIFTAATQAGVACWEGWAGPSWLVFLGRAWLWFMLAVLVSCALAIISVELKKGHHRPADLFVQIPGWQRDLIAAGLATLMVWKHYDIALAAPAVGVGMLAHIIGDSMTVEGDPWLFPYMHHFHLPPLIPLWFHEGEWFETWAVLPVSLAVLLGLIAYRAGAPFGHYWTELTNA